MRNREQDTHEKSNAAESPSETQIEIQPVTSEASGLEGMGKLSLTEDHAVYTGSSHWATILDDVSHEKPG